METTVHRKIDDTLARAIRAGRLAALAALAVALLVTAPALAADQAEGGGGSPVRYQVAFEGVEDKRLLDLLRSVSRTVELRDKPPASLFLLRGRARSDLKKLKDAMASRGYFAAKADFSVDEGASPVAVTFKVDPGGAFLLKWVDVELPEGGELVNFTLPEAGELGLSLDAPAVSKDIVDAQEKLVMVFKNKGRPFARLVRRKAVADFRELTLHVTYIVDPGPRAVFGPTVFTGLKTVEEGLVAPLVPWREGEEYSQEKVDLLRRRLTDLGLFAKASVAPRRDLEDRDKAVIEAGLTERKHRTFKGGVTYNTDDGPGARVFWEHRNLFGRGERLRLQASASPVNKFFEAKFEQPFFLDRNQRLLAGFKAADENTDAYHGQNVTAEVKVTRKLGDRFSAEAGAGWRSSLVYDDAANPDVSDTRYNLASVLLGLSADTRDDPLDATRGWLLSLGVMPHFGVRGESLNFVKASVSGAHYLNILEKPSVVLASRVCVGSLSGVGASKLVPPDVRFYAGGSGSIRGYAYQKAGPLRGDKPLGGRSLFDFSAELRLRLTELFGLVFFLDGGNAYETEYPDPGKGILAGVGTGVRLFTPIGPFRVDVATPLYRRKDVDDAFQLYISLGQAF
uniref:Outer membrane protein assembly factor n=1 Tax=Fundidesulfovibrio putealis TaxID=270496 RepID=A0A7C4AI50_9BACT